MTKCPAERQSTRAGSTWPSRDMDVAQACPHPWIRSHDAEAPSETGAAGAPRGRSGTCRSGANSVSNVIASCSIGLFAAIATAQRVMGTTEMCAELGFHEEDMGSDIRRVVLDLENIGSQ